MNHQGTTSQNEYRRSAIQNRTINESSSLDSKILTEEQEQYSSLYGSFRTCGRSLEETNLREKATNNDETNQKEADEEEVDIVKNEQISENYNVPDTIVEETSDKLKNDELNKTKQQSKRKYQLIGPADHADGQKDFHTSKYFSKKNDKASKDAIRNWQTEMNLPWSRMGEREQNLSIPMFLYLTHNETKKKNFDLSQRELQACKSYRWDEALRFRDMRNKLSLARETDLLNAVGLELDEEIRSAGLESIAKRCKIIQAREKLCADGSLYSEDAHQLWKKWEKEDKILSKEQPYIQCEDLMNNLEEEWRNLAAEDKDRISHLYEKSKYASSLQEQHNVMKLLNAKV